METNLANMKFTQIQSSDNKNYTVFITIWQRFHSCKKTCQKFDRIYMSNKVKRNVLSSASHDEQN